MIDHDKLEELREVFRDIDRQNKIREDEVWNSLGEDAQLDVFCAIIRKLKQAELEEGQSYRGVLYGTFGFDLDAYGRAQMAGFLDIHNSIVTKCDIRFTIEKFVEAYNLNVTEEQIESFMKGVR